MNRKKIRKLYMTWQRVGNIEECGVCGKLDVLVAHGMCYYEKRSIYKETL